MNYIHGPNTQQGGEVIEALKGSSINRKPTLTFKKLDDSAIMPKTAHKGDAGLDLCAIRSGWIYPGESAIVGTGLAIEIPDGFAGFVLPRSGLAASENITIVNSPGLIDSGYRGEIQVILHKLYNPNQYNQEFEWDAGDRIAQLVIQKVENLNLAVVEILSTTDRGEGGLGSTGQ